MIVQLWRSPLFLRLLGVFDFFPPRVLESVTGLTDRFEEFLEGAFRRSEDCEAMVRDSNPGLSAKRTATAALQRSPKGPKGNR